VNFLKKDFWTAFASLSLYGEGRVEVAQDTGMVMTYLNEPFVLHQEENFS
jgi:hypothetical protein